MYHYLSPRINIYIYTKKILKANTKDRPQHFNCVMVIMCVVVKTRCAVLCCVGFVFSVCCYCCCCCCRGYLILLSRLIHLRFPFFSLFSLHVFILVVLLLLFNVAVAVLLRQNNLICFQMNHFFVIKFAY